MSYRLGFAVKVLGNGGMKSNDGRRWQSGPHLRGRSSCSTWSSTISTMWTSWSIACRASRFLRHASGPAAARLPAADRRVRGRWRGSARRRAVSGSALEASRPYSVLSSPDPEIRARRGSTSSRTRCCSCARTGPEAVVVIHVGGVYGDARASLDRWVRSFEALSESARSRLVVEHDERCFDLSDALELHERTGVRVVFDLHHHRCNPCPWPGGRPCGAHRCAGHVASRRSAEGARVEPTDRVPVGGRPPAASTSRPARRFPQSVGSPDASRRSRPTAGRHGRGEGEGSRRALGAAGSRPASGKGGLARRRRGRVGSSPARRHARW